jgi:hypothetical protein
MSGREGAPIGRLPPELAFVILFGSFAVLSYGYCMITDSFNGDFHGVDVTLSPVMLTLVLGLSLLPFAATYWLFKKLRNLPIRFEVKTPQHLFNWLLAVTFGWYIFITLAYGVGIMARDVYSAPAGIKPLIQVSNRVSPFYVGFLFILSSPKRARYDAPAAVLMIALSLMRASLGVFGYLAIALGFKYYDEISRSRRTILVATTVLMVGVPLAGGLLYGLRDTLREEGGVELALSEMIFARLTGRLSSYSDTAYIVQESNALASEAQQLDTFYFQREILGSVIHSDFFPELTPERILVTARTGLDLDYVSFMAGVPGNLYLAYMKSKGALFLNLMTLVLLVAGVLRTSNHFARPAMKSAGLLLLLFPLTSGVSHEFAALLVSMVVVMMTFLAADALARGHASAPPGERPVSSEE